jgi:large subunit ribosomal protein L7/L12
MADLQAIVDQLSELTVMEAAELKKMLEEHWGVEAAAPMAAGMVMAAGAPGAAAAAEEEEEQTEFTVILKEIGPKKINVIKAVRGLTSLGLAEAKGVVDGAPSPILEDVSKEAAEDAKQKLEAEGAVVEIK